MQISASRKRWAKEFDSKKMITAGGGKVAFRPIETFGFYAGTSREIRGGVRLVPSSFDSYGSEVCLSLKPQQISICICSRQTT